MIINPKLYKRTKARLAKKIIQSKLRLNKLNYAANLKIGDVLSTCIGFNQRIKDIYPIFVYTRRGYVIIDYDYLLSNDSICSAIHCCTFPTKTREQIYDYWKGWIPPSNLSKEEKIRWRAYSYRFDIFAERIEKIRKNGNHVFNEDGELYDYSIFNRNVYEIL